MPLQLVVCTVKMLQKHHKNVRPLFALKKKKYGGLASIFFQSFVRKQDFRCSQTESICREQRDLFQNGIFRFFKFIKSANKEIKQESQNGPEALT